MPDGWYVIEKNMDIEIRLIRARISGNKARKKAKIHVGDTVKVAVDEILSMGLIIQVGQRCRLSK